MSMRYNNNYSEEVGRALNTWVKLARASSTLHRKTAENIRSFGLTEPQFAVIEALGHLGPMKIGILCNKMLVSGGNMTLVLDNLEKNDLIRRNHSKEDRRAILVELTKKGNELFSKIFPEHAEFVTGLMNVLSKKEQEQIGLLLKKLGLGIVKKFGE